MDLFDSRTTALGATTDQARAALVGIDRVTMWRWRVGRLTPSLDRAMALAQQLGVTVNDLFEEVVA
jgi:DNA-binding XRE family transcriptional regulator